MEQPTGHQPQHEPHGAGGRKALLGLRFWVSPFVISLALLSGFAMLYFGGILNPTTNLRHFPIAIVNQDAGPTGKTITDGLVANMDRIQFDLRVLSADEARHQLDTAKVYAEVLLPRDLTQRLLVLPQATLQPGQPAKPVITIVTNPRASAMGAAIAEKAMAEAMAGVNAKTAALLTPLLPRLNRGAAPPGGVASADRKAPQQASTKAGASRTRPSWAARWRQNHRPRRPSPPRRRAYL